MNQSYPRMCIKVQIQNALNRYSSESLQVFKDWTGKAALLLLEKGFLPEDIRQTSEEDLLTALEYSHPYCINW
ncbi:hypothetical protein [Thalassobacillus sp. CUG 92003]|uniref:hypothetical protein n=1 Tax=Thalassobacillus sp. CUG 92003 TaxID=2736641 RepID=UPI002102856F|nr:hypothetical protein [Thalassobacillus sp. CUG 92003]